MEHSELPANDERPLEELEAEIGQLSAHLSAATCRWLLLIAEFERREGFWAYGARTCAEWLSWRCGLSLVTAREHLRVARRLEELPAVRTAFGAGELSYSKARAICRIATQATEEDLVVLARYGTASHVDRVARAKRKVDRQIERDETQVPNNDWHLGWYWDDDGALLLNGRFSPVEGAMVLQALESGRHALEAAAKGEPGDSELSTGTGDAAASSSSVDKGATRAAGHHRPSNVEALVLMAETMLQHGPAERDGGDRYQVVVVADAKALGRGGEGVCEVEGGPALSADTARMLSCDARLLALLRGDDGEVLNVGRAKRSIPRHIRRALQFRDKGCRFPGCHQVRWVDGHHIVHWANGGETSLANLVLLCRFHHQAIHERGFGVTRDATSGQLVFTTPDGDVLPGAPPPDGPVDLDVEAINRRLGVLINTSTGACLWGGERLDLGLAIDGLLGLEGRN